MFESEVRRLAVGDYLVDGRFLFERKTLADLALSIKQGRAPAPISLDTNLGLNRV
ncbi:MAG: hypothetical protein AB1768_21085 [Pseudomonadota bacterium]